MATPALQTPLDDGIAVDGHAINIFTINVLAIHIISGASGWQRRVWLRAGRCGPGWCEWCAVDILAVVVIPSRGDSKGGVGRGRGVEVDRRARTDGQHKSSNHLGTRPSRREPARLTYCLELAQTKGTHTILLGSNSRRGRSSSGTAAAGRGAAAGATRRAAGRRRFPINCGVGRLEGGRDRQRVARGVHGHRLSIHVAIAVVVSGGGGGTRGGAVEECALEFGGEGRREEGPRLP